MAGRLQGFFFFLTYTIQSHGYSIETRTVRLHLLKLGDNMLPTIYSQMFPQSYMCRGKRSLHIWKLTYKLPVHIFTAAQSDA